MLALTCLVLLAVAPPAFAGGVTFEDIAPDPASGIDYQRVPSTTYADYLALAALPIYGMPEIIATPEKNRGAPGVALLDFDGDGDLDIYATNGPGAANSLFANQLADRGALSFVDVGAASGAGATDQDSTGVCYGDLDNDGDPDLVVLGRMEATRLFENLGDGTFADVTAGSGLETSVLGQSSCSVGDVDGDGLLDLFVANSFDWSTREAIFVDAYASSQPNLLFANQGGLVFTDATASSGVLDLTGFRPPADGGPTITWAVALVDYDQDGDVDIFQADDQAAIPYGKYGGIDRGYIHLLENDGTGRFTDVTVDVGLDRAGEWMGLSFADFNCDGRLDLFGSNMGDYAFTALPIPNELGDSASRWFLGNAAGGFDDPGVGDLVATPFGWSTMAPDYDNDGDPDILYFGSLHGAAYLSTGENPGAILENQGCAAEFRYDATAEATVDHGRRSTQGGAAGDLDGDGFVDLVTVAAQLYPGVPRTPYGVTFGSPFDPPVAAFIEQFSPVGPMQFVWNGYTYPNGTLTVEINSGGTRNRLYGVKAGDRVSFPEIPCSYDANWDRFREYRSCVVGALRELRQAGVVEHRDAVRLYASALIAYLDPR